MAGQRLRSVGPPLRCGCPEVVIYLLHRTILFAAFDVILASSNVVPAIATRSSSTNNTKRRRRAGGLTSVSRSPTTPPTSTLKARTKLWARPHAHSGGARLCQLSRRLIDYVSAILPRAQAVSRMPSAITALRMCCQRRVAAGTCWHMRDRQRRKFRSSSWPRQYRLADPVLFNPSIGRHRPLMPR
jgi:hypothetical protein